MAQIKAQMASMLARMNTHDKKLKLCLANFQAQERRIAAQDRKFDAQEFIIARLQKLVIPSYLVKRFLRRWRGAFYLGMMASPAMGIIMTFLTRSEKWA